jgi:hypothetical protein
MTDDDLFLWAVAAGMVRNSGVKMVDGELRVLFEHPPLSQLRRFAELAQENKKRKPRKRTQK